MARRAGSGTKVATDAWRLMHDLFFEGEAHDRMQEVCSRIGLSPGALKGLVHLHPDEGIAIRDLADHFDCDASYITGLADDLEKRGMAERRPHPTDRRVKTLVLTPTGLTFRDEALVMLYEPPVSFDVLTTAEQRLLRDLLQRVADADPVLARNRARPGANPS